MKQLNVLSLHVLMSFIPHFIKTEVCECDKAQRTGKTHTNVVKRRRLKVCKRDIGVKYNGECHGKELMNYLN